MAHLRDISTMDQALKSIMDASPVGFVVFDHDARAIYVNDLAEQLFGKSMDALLGNRCGDILTCHHRHTDPQGCGNSEHCPICPFYKAIQAVLEGNTDPDVAKGEALVQHKSDQPPIWFKFKASGIVLDGHKAVVMAMDDITKYKLDETALQDSENHFRMMFMNAPMPYQSLDEQGNFIEVNQTFSDVLGYSRQELIGKNFGDILHPDWVDHFKHNFPRFKAIGEILGVEFEMVKKDGTTILVFFNGRIQRDEQGRFHRTHCIFQDITERRQAEEALHRAEIINRKMIANIGDVIVIIDKEGVNRHKSPNIEKWFGWKPEEVIGFNTLDNIHPADKHFARQFLGSLLTEPHATDVAQCRYRCKDGSYKWIEFTGTNLLDDPDIQGILGNYHDITERKRAEQKQIEGERYLKTILETTADGFWIVDPGGNFVEVNEAYCRMSGHTRDELLTLGVADIDAIETLDKTKERIVRIIANGSEIFETRHRRKDGTTFDVEMSVTYLNARGGQFICFVRDISERKRAEGALRESERDLRASQQIAHVGSWRLDVATNQVSWTEELYNMYGFDPALPPPPYTEHMKLFTPESWERLSTSLVNTRETGVAYELELETVRKDGGTGWMWVRGEAIRDSDGNIVGLWGAAQDITDRKRAVEALRQSEEKFRLTFAASPDSVNINRLEDGLYVDINQGFTRLTGFTREDVIGKTSLEINIWHDPDDRKKLVRGLRAKGIYENLEAQFRRKDGTLINALMSATVIHINNEPHTINITRDITEFKRVQNALRESEEKYRTLVETAGEAIFVARNGMLIFTNPKTEEISGYTAEELQSRPFIDFIHPDDHEMVMENHLKRMRGIAVPLQYGFRIIHKLGTIRLVELNVVQIAWGKEPATLNFLTDITERKRMEEALRESEERFYKAFMFNPAPLVISDIKTGQFIDVNDRWIQMLGFSKEEQIGHTSKQVGIWDNPDERDRLVKQLEDNGFFKDERIVFRKKSGEKIHARWSAESVLLAGRQVMLSMIFDETDRIKSEQEKQKLQNQLIQAQKMESVGRLAGGVAHDFNNMLSVIIGNAELAIENMASIDPLHNNLSEIFSAARRSADITSQLLAFARKQTIAPKVVDLNAIVERMLRMLGRLIGEDIDLAWMPGNLLWPVKIDPSQIDQILANLCVNARDAIAGAGKVTIETGNITFDDAYCEVHAGFLPGQYLMLAISDDGCGMGKEILQHIFEPFFTTKGSGKGTGLGLPTVYGIVKQNSGFINVYSEPGKGTTFRIYLPRHVGDEPPMMVANSAPTPRGNGETVLLVEDEPSIMRMAEMMLKRLGYQVLAAGTPEQALALAAQYAGKIDLLMTDVVMPLMNGRHLANQIHSLCPKLKTVFMSGYTANVIAHHGILDEDVNFIQKPFSLHDLAIKISTVLKALNSTGHASGKVQVVQGHGGGHAPGNG